MSSFDAVCETLLIAHEVGGTDVDRRLTAALQSSPNRLRADALFVFLMPPSREALRERLVRLCRLAPA